MAIITSSIGSNSSIDTETPSGSTGSGPWVVTFGTTPTGISVGDKAFIVDNSGMSDYDFRVTAISGSDITLTYVSDTGENGDTDPYGMVGGDFVSQASVVFKRYYATITIWAADLDSEDLYSSGDNAVGECHPDSTFVESSITIEYGDSVGLASITLTAHSGSRHDGTKGSGVIVQNSGSGYQFLLNTDNITLSWLEIDGTDNKAKAITIQADGVYIQNNLIYDFATTGIIVCFSNNSCCPYYTNNFIWNFTRSGSGTASIFYSTGTGAGIKCYNNTVYHLDFGATQGNIFFNNWADDDTKIRNLVLMDFGDENLSNVSVHASAVLDYWGLEATHADVDNEVIDTVADTFTDSTVSDPNLHLKSLSLFLRSGVDLGTSPTNVNIDIDGRDRDAEGDTWDIGADQCESCATGGAGTAGRNLTLLGVG